MDISDVKPSMLKTMDQPMGILKAKDDFQDRIIRKTNIL